MLSYKLILRKVDKNIESFLETQKTMEKSNSQIDDPNKNSVILQILDEFPVKDLKDLKKIERKLKKDDTLYSKLVNISFLLILHINS